MTPWIWVNIGSGNGLLIDGTMLLPQFKFNLKSFIVTQQIHIKVKQEDEKRHIIHNSAKVYQAM